MSGGWNEIFFFIYFFKKLLVSSECLLIHLKPDKWENKTLQDLFGTEEQPQIMLPDLSKSNVNVTF